MPDPSPLAGAAPRAPEALAQPVSVVIIEDNRLLREGIAAMLRRQPDIEVLAAVSDPGALPVAGESPARLIVLLDVGLVDDDSLAVCARLVASPPAVRVVVMGMAALQDDVADFVHAGAVGFIMKDATSEEFVATIRHIAVGGQSLPRALTHSLFTQIMRDGDYASPEVVQESVRLTTREKEIIALLGEGLSNKEIAARLYIAIHTVKSHVHNILEKLSLNSRLEVAAFSRSPGNRR
jgi:two-component system, NarL family, response regulator DevR